MHELRIRATEPEDAEAIHHILNCPGVVAGTLQLPYRSLAQRREWLSRRSSDGASLVAEVDGRVAAISGCIASRATGAGMWLTLA